MHKIALVENYAKTNSNQNWLCFWSLGFRIFFGLVTKIYKFGVCNILLESS